MNSVAHVWLILATIVVGFSVPIQTGINAQLGKHLGNPFLASFFSFCVGMLSVLGVILVSQPSWPSMARIAETPWWAWTGGMFGALFVTVAILMAPRLGATTTLSLIVAGQMIASLFFDHYGHLGFPQHPLSWLRFLGVMLLMAGVFMIQRF